ncbi:putative MFS family arabinose efflux permease [Cytobacillus firmus]|uniref:Putative MFS family arabinose efflux permease n=2 Tax=Cytobacillus TaxID=2675230 RepID=A0A366K003_CYTFI|nr:MULTISPECIES: MFS transporter [Cytobacillus]RBP95034.1 putative MFS family arabinose efflux permease [Cytobacillus firmus]TDX43875.1 putative MFS family arabinose efflux permease [Cytobacillus oceanisediminis]
MKPGIFKPLKLKPFRSLFGAQLFSDLGNWLDFIALQVIVAYHWGLDETAIASVIIVLGLPWVIIGPFASVFVDRLPKKAVMIVCLLLRIVFVGGLFYAPNLYILLLFVFLKGTVSALYDPARQSAIRMVVPDSMLPEAVTLSQLSVNTMKIAAPALGGGIIAVLGPKSPFLFEAAGFVVSIIFLLFLPSLTSFEESDNRMAETSTVKTSFWKEFSEGIKHIFHAPLLRISIILSSAAFFIIFLYDGLFIFIAKQIGFNEGNFGLLISAVGAGSVAGSLLLGQWTGWNRKPVHLMSSSAILSGTFIVAVGLGGLGFLNFPPLVWIIGACLLGLLGAGESVPYGYVLQSETPKQMMGRVSAAAMSLQTFSMLIAPAAGALLAKQLGASFVMIGAGLATTLLGSTMLMIIWKKSGSFQPIRGKQLDG